MMAARASVPYCIAVAAVDRALGQAHFAPARIAGPLVRRVLARTETIADETLDKSAKGTLDELFKWGEALKPMHAGG